jgi:(S)-sulfolactate dehydrogenase
MSDALPRIIITEPMDRGAVAALRAAHETLHDPTLAGAPDRLAACLAEARALIVRDRTRVDAALLGHAPKLSVIGRLGVGPGAVDLAACRTRGVEVIPATGANADSVAEYAMLAIGQLLRGGAFAASAAVAGGAWPRAALARGREIRGKTLGIIGFGDIGRRVARLARAFGMVVVAHDPVLPEGHAGWTETPTERLELDALLARADAVTVHVPAIPATRNLLSAARLALMRPGAVLVNTASGEVLEEAALAEALRAGRLGGAALDVFAEEPLSAGSPLGAAVLEGCPNLILSPHIAGVTEESEGRVSTVVAERVLVALAMG